MGIKDGNESVVSQQSTSNIAWSGLQNVHAMKQNYKEILLYSGSTDSLFINKILIVNILNKKVLLYLEMNAGTERIMKEV